MRKRLLLFLMFIFTSPVYAIKPGVYYCVIDSVVGIQKNTKTGQTYHGNIKPDKDRFVIKVKEYNQSDLTKITDCAKDLLCNCSRGKSCLSAYDLGLLKIENNGEYGDGKKWLLMTIPLEKNYITRGTLVGVSENLFYGDMMSFWISPDLNYSLINFVYDGGDSINSYTETGHCENFQ